MDQGISEPVSGKNNAAKQEETTCAAASVDRNCLIASPLRTL
jgi:hypothetical protein